MNVIWRKIMQPPRFNTKLFLAIAIPTLLCALYLALSSARRLGVL
jgi:hypothetical protein